MIIALFAGNLSSATAIRMDGRFTIDRNVTYLEVE